MSSSNHLQQTQQHLHHHHNYNFAMQKYVLLQEQHEELCTHLDQIRPRASPTTSIASISYSPAVSPTRCSSEISSASSTSSASPSPPIPRRQRSREGRCLRSHHQQQHDSLLNTIPDEETLCEISAEEQRLSDVNESIKRALTEMLNCDAVRGDMGMRMWVQTRLMETEKELRSGRRRKSSGSVE